MRVEEIGQYIIVVVAIWGSTFFIAYFKEVITSREYSSEDFLLIFSGVTVFYLVGTLLISKYGKFIEVQELTNYLTTIIN